MNEEKTNIPITVEILAKMGFEKHFINGIHVYGFTIGDFQVSTCGRVMNEDKIYEGELTLTMFYGVPPNYNRAADMIYVHELQIRYFSLTGKCIQFNP